MKKLPVDRFVIAILLVVLLAYLFPYLGSQDSSIPLAEISSIGVSIIFFFYGLKLSPEKLKSGLANWKLHFIVQSTTFLIFPLIVLAFKPLFSSEEGQLIWLSFFFLAALPSTVSSSVVMVSLAKGNIPAAIFNASISGLIGIIVTPLWMGLFLGQASEEFDMSGIYYKLLLEILLPIIFGLLLQRWLGKWASKYNKQLGIFDKTIILLIIYKSFAESFSKGIFASMNWLDIIFISLGVSGLFFFIYYLIKWVTIKIGFDLEDQIATTFCGTKKSLVHGTVFSKILFPATIPMGYILMPLMLFHAWQILFISVIATKLGNRA